jgi:hypothetical protein
MAIPRVFISSTFYDLKQIREDIERFVKGLGYEAVRHETGNIPYGKDHTPEIYAYREIELCDIVISVIGGRFGSESTQERPYSISQRELRTALERGIQVFIFIERSVNSEYSTYQLNKGNPNIKYRFTDDVRVYQFIEEIHALPRNNPIMTFDTSADIVQHLQMQWAGLFQRFLQEQKRLSELKILEEMKAVASTLRQLVDYLSEQGKSKDDAIQSILMINHPSFRRFAQLTKTQYRIIFTDWRELETWLGTRGYRYDGNSSHNSWDTFVLDRNPNKGIRFQNFIFEENGKLKYYTPDDWNDEWVEEYEVTFEEIPSDSDIPF